MKLELRAEGQAMRKKGFTLAQIAFHLGVNERTVYKWSSADGWERAAAPPGGASPPPAPVGPPTPPVSRVPMEPAELAASLWASLSAAARKLEAIEPGTMLHTRTMGALAKVMAELRMIGDAAEKSGANVDIEALRKDLAKRIRGLTLADDQAPELKSQLAYVPPLLRLMAGAA